MEAAALGIANTALNSVVKTTLTTIKNEIGSLLGVEEELFFIKEELEMMQGFLQVAKTEKVEDVLLSIWVKQIQELAFDVEDCLLEASVHLVNISCLHGMCSMKKRDDIAKKIRMLKTRIEDVSQRNLRYKLIKKDKKDNAGHTYDESASTRSIANVEALLVGLDDPKRKLVHLILKEHGEQDKPWKGKVISVVGMGGLGKTTLVREVYRCQEVRDEFKHFAWVTVQHPFNEQEFIESLGKQIPSKEFDDEGNKKMLEGLSKKAIKEILEKKVKEYLKDKKYLIVLDDLSSVAEWDMIEPVLLMGKGSRIIVTTRDRKPLAEHISHLSENIYEIKELSKNDALDLFFKAVYKTPNYPFVSDEGPRITETTEGDCKAQKQCITNTSTEEMEREIKEDLPHENKCNMKNGSSTSFETTEENGEVQEQCMTKDMETQASSIVQSCGRLPLAIVSIGSYLATKPKTSAEWLAMHEHLRSELANNRDLEEVDTVLTSSYDGMPYHLKPSLLYLSVFHNHKEIRRSRIIRRWMADGYLMEGRIKKAEEMKKGYFYDLMGRSLIQPSQMSTIVNGDVKRCNIHDIMYELILRKAVDESMVSVLEDGELISMTDKVRHLVITGGPCTGGKVLERVELSHMRSLSIFGEVGDYLKYSRMKLVRVLDLEGTINLNDGDLRSIGKLRHLKYLGLRGTKIRKLPNSLGKLSELETLDIRNTAVVRLPAGLTKLHKLSYLRAGSVHYIDPTTSIVEFLDRIYRTTKDWQEKVIDKCLPSIKELARSVSKVVRIFFLMCCLLPPTFPWWFLEGLEAIRFSGGVRVPRGICKLRCLNIFGVIDIGGSKSLAKEMQNLTNLRKLAVNNFTKKNGKTLGEVIDGLKHLRSLVLKARDDTGLRCCLDSISSPPKYLQSLKLHSPLGELPDWISSLENLEKIHLRETKLTRRIKVIEKLPNLKILYLWQCPFEEDLKELCFGEGTFPMLQVMILEEIKELESVVIENTALKRLEQLKIRSCWEIREDGVSGLDFLEQLKEMEVVQVLSFHNDEELQRFTGISADYLPKKQQRNNKFVSNLQDKLSMHPAKPILRVIKEEDVWYIPQMV